MLTLSPFIRAVLEIKAAGGKFNCFKRCSARKQLASGNLEFRYFRYSSISYILYIPSLFSGLAQLVLLLWVGSVEN